MKTVKSQNNKQKNKQQQQQVTLYDFGISSTFRGAYIIYPSQNSTT